MLWKDLEPGKLYIRRYCGNFKVKINEEIIAYSLKGFRRLRLTWAYYPPVTSDRDGYETRGDWEYCNPDQDIEGDVTPATEDDLGRYLNHWNGNGNPTSAIFHKDHVGEELAEKMWEMWAQRIDQYIGSGQEVPYGYKPLGYNYFRNKGYLWIALTATVLLKSTGFGDVRLVRQGSHVADRWQRALEDTGMPEGASFETEDWVLIGQGEGHHRWEGDQLTEIIKTAPRDISTCLRNLREVSNLHLPYRDDALCKAARAQHTVLKSTLAERLNQFFRMWLEENYS